MKSLFNTILCLLLLAGTAHAIAVGDKAPLFIGNDSSGSTLWVKRYFNKKTIVLSFDSTFSAASAEALREIERVRGLFPAGDVQVISINVDPNSQARLDNFYAIVPADRKFPVLIDDNWAIARLYGITSIPTRVVIDRKGIVHYVSQASGQIGDKAFESAVRGAMSGKKPRPAPKASKKGKAADAAAALRVVAPTPFTKTVTGMITVAGTAPVGSIVRVSVNGGKQRPIGMLGDTFFVRQPLTLAANFIEVESTDVGGARRQQGILVFREADAGTGIVSDAPPYHFHTAANEAPCRRCHDVTPSEEQAKGLDPKSNPCLSCHQEMAGRKIVHGPIAIGGCAACHQFKGGGERYALIAEGAELCFKCHDEFRKATTRTHKHEPASEGRCTACHDPHGSQEKFQLRRYVADLCFSCHADVQPLGGKSSHDPFQKGRCDMCHTPHGTDRDDKLLRLPGDRQCLSCHPDLPSRGHVHPSGQKTQRKLPADIVLDNMGRLLCMSCHEAHESGEIKLLRKGSCDRCHEKQF